MDWSEEELNEGERVMTYPVNPPKGSTHRRETVRAIMTRAVELAAARGGTMTAEEMDAARYAVSSGDSAEADFTDHWGAKVFEHISALGARNAVLEAELELARKGFDAGSPAEATIRTLEEEAVSLKERLSAAEEANREIVRRAQKAESLLGREQTAGRLWHGRVEAAADELSDIGAGECGRLDIVTRVKMLKARCATLSAAGQVLSAHAESGGTGCFACDTGFRPPERHPCPPTCTHDDAATPGHPERVKERGEQWEAITLTDAEAAGFDEGMSRGFDAGAEAMRAACLKTVREWCERNGFHGAYPSLKEDIEGATP